jgi:hypothetical protein
MYKLIVKYNNGRIWNVEEYDNECMVYWCMLSYEEYEKLSGVVYKLSFFIEKVEEGIVEKLTFDKVFDILRDAKMVA